MFSHKVILVIHVLSQDCSFLHVYIDTRAANHLSLIATTIDIVNAGCRDNIDAWVLLRLGSSCQRFALNDAVNGLCYVVPIIIFLISIDRVGGQITATVQFLNEDRLTSSLLHIHGNRTCDGTTGIVAAKHFLECSVRDVQRNIGIHICILGTTIDNRHILHTVQGQVDITIHRSFLTGSVGLTYTQWTQVIR